MRLVVVNVLVLWPSLLGLPAASLHRSAPLSPRSKPELRDDKWVPYVSDYVVQNGIFLFSEMDE